MHGKVRLKDVFDYDKRTPLHICVSEGREVEYVHCLMVGGADPDLKDRWGCSPLDEGRKNGHVELVARMERGRE